MIFNKLFKLIAKHKIVEYKVRKWRKKKGKIMPKISLIIPLYNAEKYLWPCLNSVAEQTFKDFEVLCINDGSTDRTEEIVKSFVEHDKRFHLLNQENACCSMARNRGLAAARSPYVALLDQDDMLHPQAFEVLYYLIQKGNYDVASFINKTVSDDFILQNPPMYKLEDIKYKAYQNPFNFYFKNKRGGSVLVWNRLYKKDAIAGIEFPKDIQPAEDTIFSLKVMFHTMSIIHTDTELLYYRDSSTSVMNRGINDKYIKSHAAAGKVMSDYFLKSNRVQNKKEKKILQKYITRFIFKSVVSQPLRRLKDEKTRVASLEQARKYAIDLYHEKALQPHLLGIRKTIACHAFFKGKYKLARLFV